MTRGRANALVPVAERCAPRRLVGLDVDGDSLEGAIGEAQRGPTDGVGAAAGACGCMGSNSSWARSPEATIVTAKAKTQSVVALFVMAPS